MMHLRECDFTAAVNDHKWYVGNVIEAPTHEREVLVSLGKRDIMDIVFNDTLCQITLPTPVDSVYDVLLSDRNKIREAYVIYEQYACD